ncbi:hypothetical protein LWF01_02410 [Saxibacter everestensis]|uniref:PH domain-containing protein n=1 Tax=Saxibacter everestensis TaxID=2909229 RepID=A0ABY8QUM2_9MICO|nr:hypothetical protein LWF01_02410 [Brevibacteriaceae bacterium ZFBP1038]
MATTIYRPSWRQHRKFIASASAFIVIYIGITVTQVILAGPAALLALGAILAVMLGLLALYFGRSRVEVSTGQIVHRRMFSSASLDRASSALSAIDVTIWHPTNNRNMRMLVAKDRQTGAAVRLYNGTWTDSDLDNISRATGAAVAVEEDPLSFRVLDERYPGMLRWHERHQVWFGVLVAVASIVAIVGLCALVIWILTAVKVDPSQTSLI